MSKKERPAYFEGDSKKRIAAFGVWLSQRGAEIEVSTNQFEVLRARTARGVMSLYMKGSKRLTWTDLAASLWTAFVEQEVVNLNPHHNPSPRERLPRATQRLLDRDGSDCFFCLKPLENDITEEHLLARAHGGTDHIANKVLAHRLCNAVADTLPIVEKFGIRERSLRERWGVPEDSVQRDEVAA